MNGSPFIIGPTWSKQQQQRTNVPRKLNDEGAMSQRPLLVEACLHWRAVDNAGPL
jgi:hypothetical protein